MRYSRLLRLEPRRAAREVPDVASWLTLAAFALTFLSVVLR